LEYHRRIYYRSGCRRNGAERAVVKKTRSTDGRLLFLTAADHYDKPLIH